MADTCKKLKNKTVDNEDSFNEIANEIKKLRVDAKGELDLLRNNLIRAKKKLEEDEEE